MLTVIALTLSLGGLSDAPRSASLTGLGASWWVAQADTDVIETHDGNAVVGKIIDETKQGYLFKDQSGATQLIEYGRVKSVRRASGGQPPPPPQIQAPAATGQSPLEELDSIDEQLRYYKKARLDHPVAGPRASAVLGGIFGIGGLPVAIIFTGVGSAGWYASGYLVLAAIFWPLSVISLAAFLVGTIFAVKNAPRYNELTEKIHQLEEKKDRIIELERYRSQAPSAVMRPVFTVSL